MIKRTEFVGIGFGKYAEDTITIVEQFTPTNDYEGTYIEINGETVADDMTTAGALFKAFRHGDMDTFRFIMARM